MTTYAWPGWKVARFELRIVPNTRTFVGPYTPATQVIDLLGERWRARIDLVPTTDSIETAAREAWFDRLKGPANLFTLYNLSQPAPQGTISGAPTLSGAVAQLANTCVIQTTAGKTVRAGDMLGIAGQLVRVMADATADGGGLLTVEFQPRARIAWGNGAAVTLAQPTANFMLAGTDGVPIPRLPGFSDGVSFEAIEVF